MSEKVDLTEVELDNLIKELADRGHTVDRESDIDDFDEHDLREALGLLDDDNDVNWNHLFNLFHARNESDAISEIKAIIQQKTGRILI